MRQAALALATLSLLVLVSCAPPNSPPPKLQAPAPPQISTDPGTVVPSPALPRPTATLQIDKHSPTLMISPETVTAKAGDNFTVSLVITTNDFAVRGAQSALSFDPVALLVDRVEEGTYFKSWAVPRPTVLAARESC